MASGQIKKGFFFYFGMFVLLLLTVFLICLVIMIFNPGKTILWMKYFTGNETYVVAKTTDTIEQPIDWSAVSTITINAPSYAKVTIDYTQTKNVAGSKKSDSGLYIKNHAKGFQGAANAVNFGYEATLTPDAKFTLTVSEPNGFLFFSKDLEIVIHSSAYPNQPVNFNGKSIVINGGSGDVVVGRRLNTNDKQVTLSSLYVNTTSGDVLLDSSFDTTSDAALVGQINIEGKENLGALFISTNSGSISANQIVDGGKGLALKKNATFKTNKGDIRLGRVIADGTSLQFECKTGTIVSSYMRASSISVKCTHGNYNINKVEGNLSFAESAETIISPNIIIQEITGNFLIGTELAKANPDVTIGKVGGFSAICDKGNLSVGEASGAVTITGNSTNISLNLAAGNTQDVKITNGSGSTKVGIKSQGAVGNISVTSRSGVTFTFTTQAQFKAVSYKYDAENLVDHKGQQFEANDSNINVTGFDHWTGNKCPFINGGYSGSSENVTVITGGKVTFTLVKSFD